MLKTLFHLFFFMTLIQPSVLADHSFSKELKYLKSKESLYEAHLKPLQKKSNDLFKFVLGIISNESEKQLSEDLKIAPLTRLDQIDQKILLKKIIKEVP